MAQTLVSFRMDSSLKREMEELCYKLGLNMTTAFNIFARKMTRENRIPFDVSIEKDKKEEMDESDRLFYSEPNISYITKVIKEIEEGKAKLVEHDLIEVD